MMKDINETKSPGLDVKYRASSLLEPGLGVARLLPMWSGQAQPEEATWDPLPVGLPSAKGAKGQGWRLCLYVEIYTVEREGSLPLWVREWILTDRGPNTSSVDPPFLNSLGGVLKSAPSRDSLDFNTHVGSKSWDIGAWSTRMACYWDGLRMPTILLFESWARCHQQIWTNLYCLSVRDACEENDVVGYHGLCWL